MALLMLLAGSAGAQDQDVFNDEVRLRAWIQGLTESRRVVDQVVVCFDQASFLREISAWDETRFWPVLLWDSSLVPKFVEAFGSNQVLLAKYAKKDASSLGDGLKAVAAAWGVEATGAEAGDFLEVLRGRKRPPNGAVLLAENSPEFLGGVALAAGRFHLPLAYSTKEKHAKRVSFEAKEAIRKDLVKTLDGLEIKYRWKLDDLDFVTVANDMPFGYTLSDPDAHPGGYTIDDAIARTNTGIRWGWVGRLAGGPARSVYMAMGALFLQPKQGLFWSRYDAGKAGFGDFDPRVALATFRNFFSVEAICHPDATLARWREVQWPSGNQFGFLYVNSSGGATNWSTSKGGATHFDVPDSVPAVVHYTHSGSAGRPFHVDTIAGRWMANGAYIYFGSYAEPYLGAFIPPKPLADRVKVGIPLGAAMRHFLSPRTRGRRPMKVKGVEKVVEFNMSGPWKLAYFGDPSYRLVRASGDRLPPGKPGKNYYRSVGRFRHARRPKSEKTVRHKIDAIAIVLLDTGVKKLVDASWWSKLAKSLPAGEEASAALEAMARVWVASLKKDHSLYDRRRIKVAGKVPAAITKLISGGAATASASREFSGYARSYIMRRSEQLESDVAKDPVLARWVLETACCLPPSKGERKQFFAWIKQACNSIGVEPGDLREAILRVKWLPDETRKLVTRNLAAAPKKEKRK